MAAAGELSRSILWSRFLETFAKEIALWAVVVRPKHIVVWRDEDLLNRVELLRWTWPDASSRAAPRVTRIGLNTQRFTPSKALLRHLGFEPESLPPSARSLHLEWSVLGEELLAFAEWLPLWIRGRQDASVEIPLPPCPSHVFGQGLRATNYAWTVAAWDAYSRWHKQDPRLPWYAINARDVVAAEAGA